MDLLGQRDPRSMQGMLARGANIYQGTSNSPYAGKPTANSMQPVLNSTSSMQQASMLPHYQKMSLQDVARKVLSGGQ